MVEAEFAAAPPALEFEAWAVFSVAVGFELALFAELELASAADFAVEPAVGAAFAVDEDVSSSFVALDADFAAGVASPAVFAVLSDGGCAADAGADSDFLSGDPLQPKAVNVMSNAGVSE